MNAEFRKKIRRLTAIIVQRYMEVESRLLRVMAVVKVRARAHSDQLRLYSIDEQGIKIGQMLTGQEGLLGGRPASPPPRGSYPCR